MSVFAIGDLHLSHQVEKPMDIFGDGWANHSEQIERNWNDVVMENDTVILPGDFSWATYLEQAVEDFLFLENLPGRKIMLKGNHDYWWETVTKMQKFLDSIDVRTIGFLYNNCLTIEEKCYVGTKGFDFENEKDQTIRNREIIRFGISLDAGENCSGEKIAVFHFPPDNNPDFIEMMKQNDINRCFFGHIHGKWDKPNEFESDGIHYINVSADRIGFRPYMI
jgi:predicted phosphohydrolase